MLRDCRLNNICLASRSTLLLFIIHHHQAVAAATIMQNCKFCIFRSFLYRRWRCECATAIYFCQIMDNFPFHSSLNEKKWKNLKKCEACANQLLSWIFKMFRFLVVDHSFRRFASHNFYFVCVYTLRLQLIQFRQYDFVVLRVFDGSKSRKRSKERSSLLMVINVVGHTNSSCDVLHSFRSVVKSLWARGRRARVRVRVCVWMNVKRKFVSVKLPERICIHPQMWKTVVDFKKNKNTKSKMVSMAVMTDNPTNAVAT